MVIQTDVEAQLLRSLHMTVDGRRYRLGACMQVQVYCVFLDPALALQ